MMRFSKWLIPIGFATALSACSAQKLAEGIEGPDWSGVKPGIPRTEAEGLLGGPQRSWKTDRGIRYALYEIDVGLAPDPGTAALTVVGNIVAFGVIELGRVQKERECGKLHGDSGTDFERCVARRFYGAKPVRILVSYDEQGRVLGLFNEFDRLPADGRSETRPAALSGDEGGAK